MRYLLPAMVAFCAIALGAGAPAAGAGTVTVTSPDGLNLRAAPNTQAQILATIPLGSVLTLTGDPTPDHWYPVTYGGLNGWAYGAYLADGLVNPATAVNAAPIVSTSPVPTSSPQAMASGQPAASASPAPAANAQPAPSNAASAPPATPASPAPVTNTRPAPSSAPNQQTASAGAAGAPPALSTQAGPPNLQPAPGQPASISATTGASPASLSPGTMMMVNTDALNLRASPDMNGRILMALPKGTYVQVAGAAAANNWLPVVLNGLSGFVDSTYLVSPAGPASTTANAVTNPASSAGSTLGLSAAVFGNPTMGTPAGPEAGMNVANAPTGTMGKFIWPVAMRRITTVFKSYHQAIDIDQFPGGGNPVSAMTDGIVTYAGGDACCSYGLYVIVQHREGFSSLYSHLSRLDVSQGQLVRQGLQLGLSGNTGNSTGPHLHFAIYYNGQPLDPLSVLPGNADVMPYANLPGSGQYVHIGPVAD